MSRSKNKKPIIGITVGDPRGIGPEVTRKALQDSRIRKICQPIVFGDPKYFNWKSALSLTPQECGQLSGHFVKIAAYAALRGEIDAIVTGPISKEHLNLGGYHYPGHTEFLADLANVKEVRMMMAGPKLKVVLTTIHEPLKKVPSLLSQKLIEDTIHITAQAMTDWFGLTAPRIAVAALNPHAGESGLMGTEEKTILVPVIQRLRRRYRTLTGPHPADTVFYRALHGEFDVVIVMYHDQGLIPVKLLHFEEAVNITLGLPFIRTSVDHGTAFDIAGRGIASPTSMIAAIKMAVRMANRQKT